MHFDHAGIVTDDADTLAETYSELLDVPVAHRETFEGMAVVFLDTGDGYFELLEPLDDDAAVTRFLDENGPGIHHVALATDDIETALQRADGMGVERIDEEPRPGAWGHEVAFLHPKDTSGILVEFVEH